MQHCIADLIDGTNDGILATFAIVAGVSEGDLSPGTVPIVGVANLCADGLSMGVGNYLGIRAHESALEARDLPGEEACPWRHGLATFLAFAIARGDTVGPVSSPWPGPSVPRFDSGGPGRAMHRGRIALAGNGESMVG